MDLKADLHSSLRAHSWDQRPLGSGDMPAALDGLQKSPPPHDGSLFYRRCFHSVCWEAVVSSGLLDKKEGLGLCRPEAKSQNAIGLAFRSGHVWLNYKPCLFSNSVPNL